MAHLVCGRLIVLRDEEPHIWTGDTLARVRGRLLIPATHTESGWYSLLQETEDVVSVPRCFPLRGVTITGDHRTEGDPIRVEYRDRPDIREKKKLTLSERDLREQATAANFLVERDGFVVAKPGQGKTIIGVRAICQVKRRALVIVNTTHLLHQWRDRFRTFTTLRDHEIGLLQGKGSVSAVRDCPVVIAMTQTLWRMNRKDPTFFRYGVVIVDECHETPAHTLYDVLLRFSAKRFWGLTATPDRTDGLWFLVPWVMGGCAYDIEGTEYPTVRMIPTKAAYFRLPPQVPGFWSRMLTHLTRDESRQITLAHQVQYLVKQEQRKVILLSDRIKQLEDLNERLGDLRRGVIIGAVPMSTRTKIGNTKDVILATMGCLKKGADFPRFDTLVLGTPFSSHVTAVQTAGRVFSRNNPGKKPPLVVVPYDRNVRASARCTAKLLRHAERMGWKFEDDK